MSDAKLKSAIERWKAGTPASELANEYGISRREMRKRIADALGGKAAYQAARAAGAGGKIEAFGGKTAAPRVVVAVDDSKVKTLSGAKGSTVEWKSAGKHQIEVFTIAGQQYVRAHPNERAHLIVRSKKTPSLPLLRLRNADESSALKKIRREQKLLKRGEQALEKTRATKRAARVARKIRRKK